MLESQVALVVAPDVVVGVTVAQQLGVGAGTRHAARAGGTSGGSTTEVVGQPPCPVQPACGHLVRWMSGAQLVSEGSALRSKAPLPLDN